MLSRPVSGNRLLCVRPAAVRPSSGVRRPCNGHPASAGPLLPDESAASPEKDEKRRNAPPSGKGGSVPPKIVILSLRVNYTATPNSRNASLSDVLVSVEAFRCPMINAQGT